MSYRLITIIAFLLLSGCLYGGRESVNQTMSHSVNQPYDLQGSAGPLPPAQPMASFAPTQPGPQSAYQPALPPAPPVRDGAQATQPQTNTDIRTVSYLNGAPATPVANETVPPNVGFNLNVPKELPGSETPLVTVSRDPDERRRQVTRLYPALPTLADEPEPVMGMFGRPYTLADFQQMAAANSPALRQAAADIQAARGNMIQANAYPNPTLSYQMQPSNNGATPGSDGVGIDQVIKTGGKLRLATAAAEMAMHNAEVAFRKARSDLSTSVRNAYFALIVSKETVRVNKAMVRFTDEVYSLQARMLEGGFAAPYEPAALRAQAYTERLAYKQSVQTYIYNWKQLVSTINLRQLPLSHVAGRVDSMIPLYEYDAVLAYVLRNHPSVLTARNDIEMAKYQLKLAQVTPIPDVDVNVGVLKDFSVDPKQTTPTLGLAIPLGVWDRNQGAILAAEAALIRAEEEPHAAEMQLTNQLANNFTNYKNNLEALDYYRNYILPDQVRTYRGTFHRRQVDPNASFGDLVQAQQTLTTNVATYLTILGQLWTSVVSVADLIETDDLFAFSRPQTVPALPDVSQLPQLPCCHEPSTGSPAASATAPVPMSSNMPSSMPSSMLSNMSTNGPAGPGPMSGSMPLSGTVPVGGPAFAAGPMPVVGPAPVSGAGLEPFVGRGRE